MGLRSLLPKVEPALCKRKAGTCRQVWGQPDPSLVLDRDEGRLKKGEDCGGAYLIPVISGSILVWRRDSTSVDRLSISTVVVLVCPYMSLSSCSSHQWALALCCMPRPSALPVRVLMALVKALSGDSASTCACTCLTSAVDTSMSRG